MFARSLAGHDKGKLYIIISTDAEYVYLADGNLRTLDKLKKKRFCHVQIDGHIDDAILSKLESLKNEDVKRAIKLKEAKARR